MSLYPAMNTRSIVASLLLIAAMTGALVAPLCAAENERPSGTGRIKGTIRNYDTKELVAGQSVLILAVKGAPDEQGWAPVDDLHMPVTTSQKGEFVFEKLPPGQYSLMVQFRNPSTVGMATMGAVRKPDGSALIIALKDGETADIGEGWVQAR